jgi:hypothetical protein
MQSNTNREEFIEVPVPVRHYPSVMAHLGRLLAEEAGGSGSTDQQSTVERTPSGRVRAASQPRVEWKVEELQDLRRRIDSRPAVKALVEMLLAKDGKEVPIVEYEASTSYSNRQLASALAGFTQMVGRDFHRCNWPFKVEWPEGAAGRAVYHIPPDLMDKWRKT